MAGVNWGLQGQGFNALEALQTFGQAQQQGMQRQQMALKQQEMQAQVAARQRAGQQLGEGDFAGAAQTAAIGGDYDFAKFASSASDDHRKQLAEQAGLIGSLAVRLKGQPPEARAQAFAALAPQLAQRGFDQNELANVDLSDVGLDNYIAMATSADQALKSYAESQKPFELSAGQARYSADGQVIAQNAPLPKWQFDSESGSWLQEPGSGPAGYAAPQAPQAQPGAGGTFQRMIGAESGGRQFSRNGQPLTSSAGAIGMAQVMPSTGPEAAKAAGLPWDPDRFRNDPEYNSRLGNAYYQKQLQAFNGDEAKAVAAYNAGPGRIRQAVQRSGDAWQESIPSETQGYLRKVLGGGQGGSPGVVNVRPPKARRNTDGAPSGYRFNGENLEPIPGGPADPSTATARNVQSNRKAESEFRKEFNGLPQVKTFNTARQQFGTLRDLSRKPNPTPQDDIAMVFGYMKTLDPSSVVREGEFAQAQNAGSVPDNVQNLYNRVLGGQRLNAKQRKEMVNTAYVNYKQYRAAYNETAEQYRGYAKDNGIAADRVARTYTPNIVKGSRQAAPAAQGRISPTIRRIN